MTSRSTRRVWLATAVAIACGSALAVLWLVTAPLDDAIVDTSLAGASTPSIVGSVARSTPPASSPSTALPTIEEIDAAARVPLRRPLVDAAPAAIVEGPSLPPLLRLTGTIIEPGRSVGVFAVGLSDVKLAAVGDTVAGAQVVNVRADRVTLRWAGREVDLALAKPSDSTEGEPNPNGSGPSGGGGVP